LLQLTSDTAYVTQIFAPIITFAVFSALSHRSRSEIILDTARIYTSLSLFALLSDPLGSLVMSLVTFMGSVGCFSRIQEFLDKDVRVENRLMPPDFSYEATESSRMLAVSEKSSIMTKESELTQSLKHIFYPLSYPLPHDAITVHDGYFGWDPTKAPILESITLTVPRKKITMVVGPVGCGKSTLLKALLGEVPCMGGTVQFSSASVAYCDQTPWHMNDTIQNSIIAMSPYDDKWYASVIRACALEEDLRQLPRGDQTVIGSKGVALSGGQSQRIVSSPIVHDAFNVADSRI